MLYGEDAASACVAVEKLVNNLKKDNAKLRTQLAEEKKRVGRMEEENKFLRETRQPVQFVETGPAKINGDEFWEQIADGLLCIYRTMQERTYSKPICEKTQLAAILSTIKERVKFGDSHPVFHDQFTETAAEGEAKS